MYSLTHTNTHLPVDQKRGECDWSDDQFCDFIFIPLLLFHDGQLWGWKERGGGWQKRVSTHGAFLAWWMAESMLEAMCAHFSLCRPLESFSLPPLPPLSGCVCIWEVTCMVISCVCAIFSFLSTQKFMVHAVSFCSGAFHASTHASIWL
jgi:hypothetical protein